MSYIYVNVIFSVALFLFNTYRLHATVSARTLRNFSIQLVKKEKSLSIGKLSYLWLAFVSSAVPDNMALPSPRLRACCRATACQLSCVPVTDKVIVINVVLTKNSIRYLSFLSINDSRWILLNFFININIYLDFFNNFNSKVLSL